MRLPRHVQRRPDGRLQFCRRVPSDLVPLIGVKVWRKSLRTHDPKAAATLAAQLNLELERRFSSLRAQAVAVDPSLMVDLPEVIATADDSKRVVSEAFTLLRRLSERMHFDAETEEEARNADAVDLYLSDLADQVMEDAASKGPIKPRLKKTIEDIKLSLYGDSGISKVGSTLLDLYRQWVKEAKPTKRTEAEVGAIIRASGKADTPVSAITRQDIVDYRKRLLAEDLSAATVVKRVSLVSTLLERAVRDGLIQSNPAKGATAGLKDSGKERRLPFSKEDIAALLSPKNLSALSSDAQLLLKALIHTGARLEEIAQIAVGDVKSTPCPHIVITDRGEQQKLKNAGSRRQVPLHKAIVKEVLAAAKGRDPSEYLLATLEVNKYGQRGAKVGKDIGKYIRAIGISDPRKTLHSARHHFKDAARDAGLPQEVHDRLTGHTTAGVGGAYGTGHSLEVLNKWVQKMTF